MRSIKHIRKAPIVEFLSSLKISKDVISLGQGVPFFSPPTEVIDRFKECVGERSGYQYSEDAGFLSVRKSIAEKIWVENHFNVDPIKNIIVTSGANQAFINALLAISEIGDEIVLFTPTYFNYVMAVQMVGCIPVLVPTNDQFQPDISKLKSVFSDRTKAIVTISPNNPTGAVYKSDDLKNINELCAKNDLYHISDEVYEYFVYDGAVHVSPAQFDMNLDHTISLYSCSKAFGMSGYRIGFMITPEKLYDDMIKVQDTVGICAPSCSQLACKVAWTMGKGFVQDFFDELMNMRKYCFNKLTMMPDLDVVRTNGANYFFVRLSTSLSSYEVTVRLAEEFDIIVLPGEIFDVIYPSFRISYGNCSLNDLKTGMDRLEKGLRSILDWKK